MNTNRNTVGHTLATFVLSLGLILTAMPVIADDFLATDITTIETLAMQGDAQAQYDIGAMYLTGECVAQDYNKAMVLLKQVDSRLAAQAEYSLAVRYDLGNGVEKSAALSQ